jgi:hypothetical protein
MKDRKYDSDWRAERGCSNDFLLNGILKNMSNDLLQVQKWPAATISLLNMETGCAQSPAEIVDVVMP